ncbi:hypothetical protein [Paenibacillus sp. PL91]|uniref:hypothetical protein n=1 Tax=Paenibacillus sp. PL91 TaxID=2729538 RepID=UPI00145DF49E|nr:hypothetical protein [Paenibacillus sp. PL91]MBC9199775.1 hypothetical protein [Paenibacillus sp. PL91]
MKKALIFGYYEVTSGVIDRYEDEGLLIADDVVAIPNNFTLDFFYVRPALEEGFYEECGFICDLDIPARSIEEIADLPSEAIAFIRWMATKKQKPLATAV